MRVELRDGQWADLRERINHGTDKEIKVAAARSRSDPGLAFDWQTTIVRAFVREWHVLDPDGVAIPIADPDAIERAPDDIIDELFEKSSDAWLGATVPNQAYAKLIGRLVMGQRVGETEVRSLPDPETFKDALLLATDGRWSPAELDATDALLLALVQQIRNAKPMTES
jgi:hypothetical protein